MIVQRVEGYTVVALGASETAAWCRRPGARWPCAVTDGAHVRAEFDPRGDLVAATVRRDGVEVPDVPVAEFDALVSDAIGTAHPTPSTPVEVGPWPRPAPWTR